jgi:hypothetical protein
MFVVVGANLLWMAMGCGLNMSTSELSKNGRERSSVNSGTMNRRAARANQGSVSEPAPGSGDRETLTAAVAPAAIRKIIYSTVLGLVVEDYQSFEKRLPALVTEYGGFVFSSNTDRRINDQQSGNWVVRIPVESYSTFLDRVSELGFTETRSENAQDVTEEFVDLDARVKNKRSLEERIIKMLEERAGKLADALEIERELARVREEIEHMEGRLRFLTDRTDLTTVTIRCREQKSYRPAEAPSLRSRMTSSWTGSTRALGLTAENAVVALAAVVPWFLVLAIPVGFVGYLLRRKNKQK